MADDLNALLQANRSSSVLDAIAHPAQVNPLAAINSANQAAQGDYDLAAKQGQLLWGQALQQSTDPTTGVVDYAKANRIAATMGPAAAQAAAANLSNNSALTGAQLEQAAARNSFVGSLAASGMNDPSDANWDKIRQQAVASGLPPGALAEIDRIRALPVEQRGAEAYKHVLGRMDALSQMARGPYAMPTMTTVGDRAVPVQMTPNTPWSGGGAVVQPGGVSLGLTPAQLAEPHTWKDTSGQEHQGTVGGYLQTLGVQIPTGGQQVPGAPRAPAAATPAGVPPPGTIPPNPNAPAGTPPGRIVPPPALANPNKPGAAPPATVATPSPATPSPAVVPPTSPAVGANIPGPAPGTAEDIAAYKADQAAIPTQVTRAQNMQHAYDALTQLKSATGKGAQGINDLRSWAQTLGILPPGAVNEQRLMEIVNKYTERAMIDAAGGSTTDMGRRMQEQANAGSSLSTPANLEILRNDLGKALQNTAAATLHDQATNGVGYLKSRGDLAKNTDPRGFVWSFYSPDEQAKILKEVKGTAADEKLHRAIGMSLDPKLQIPQVRPPPVQQKQSFNALPPMPVQNPLMMTG